MARGWESKSVESQMEDRENGLQGKKVMLSRAEQEQASKKESLEMSRRRVVNELKTSEAPVQRTALENALKFLDDELRKFGH